MSLKTKNLFLYLLIVLALLELLLFGWARNALIMNNSRIKYVQKQNIKHAYWELDQPGELESSWYASSFGLLSLQMKRELREQIAPVVESSSSDLEKYIAIRSWVHEQLSQKQESEKAITTDNPVQILDQAREGRKIFCGDYTLLYISLCHSVNLPARHISIWGNSTVGASSHAIVEVYIDGKWVVMDPTFDVHFMIGEELTSALDIHDYLYSNKTQKGKLKMVGKRRTTELIYMPYIFSYDLLLYSVYNIYWADTPIKKIWKSFIKLPVLRYFRKYHCIYIKENVNSDPFIVQRTIMFLVDLLIPAIIVAIGIIYLFYGVKLIKDKKREKV